jgi:hypothetical protein
MEAYPLYWPATLIRNNKQVKSQLKTSLAGALKNVRESLIRFGNDSAAPITDIIISSNVTLGHEKPKDAGVAIWFKWENEQRCIAVDRYIHVEDNLQAIHHIIEARRTELRHGGLHIARQTFIGFKALSEKASTKTCWEILGIPAGSKEEAIKKAYREKGMILHPDKGGSNDQFNELKEAYEQALNIK